MNFSPLRPEQKLVCPSREKKFNCGFFSSYSSWVAWHSGKTLPFSFLFFFSDRCEKQRVPFCFLCGYQGLYLGRFNNATSQTLN